MKCTVTPGPLPTISHFKNIAGKKFGRLLVTKYAGRDYRGRSYWECLCDCGKTTVIMAANINQGRTLSCSCLARDLASKRAKTHGKRHTRLYRIWSLMRDRCYNQNTPCYSDYGGRGISVCEAWRTPDSFETFYNWAMANGYRDDLTLDRFPNGRGDYEPSNCRWATPKEQARNRRSTSAVKAFGETKSYAAWEEDSRCVVDQWALCKRVANGWDPEAAMTTPANGATPDTSPVSAFGETKSIMAWSRDPRCATSGRNLYNRIRDLGWDAEKAITTPDKEFNTVLVTAFGETKSISEWSRDSRCKTTYAGLKKRICKMGLPAEFAITTPSQPRFALTNRDHRRV